MNENQNGSYQGQYPSNQWPMAQRGQGGMRKDYTVDMVFCIDATGSMEDTTGGQKRIINMVKENALNFYADLMRKMAEKHKNAMGGGDIPEDGLEALAYAIKSDWTTEGTDQRRVIVVWTDAGTHPLGYGASMPGYPRGMPRNMSELSDWWAEIPKKTSRLVLYAPDEPGWSYISAHWDNVVHYPSVAGNGLAECDYSSILDVLAQSLTK